MDDKDINLVYKQNLENDIICYLAEMCGRDIREMTDVYFSSKLALQIEQGLYGIDNMDYKYLANDLLENEPELFDT